MKSEAMVIICYNGSNIIPDGDNISSFFLSRGQLQSSIEVARVFSFCRHLIIYDACLVAECLIAETNK